MKIHFLCFALCFLLAACNQSQPAQNQDTSTQAQATAISQPAAEPAPPPADMFVGDFVAAEADENKDNSYSNKITLAIQSIENGAIHGYSVVAGNSRPFQGTYTEKGRVVSATVREPGDDPYDGVFTFQFHRDNQTVTGTWKANNARKGSVSTRTYQLEKRVFQYDPNLDLPQSGIVDADLYDSATNSESDPDMLEFTTADAVKFNASETLLRKEDVENMHKGDLEVTRNAIYARHGYSFKNRRMRYVFDRNVDWYMPVSTNVTRELTALELKNIDLLKRYEQHAERYYDSFGR